MNKKTTISIFVICLMAIFVAKNGFPASCTSNHKYGDCSCWLKAGGYCTDYIKLKTGKKQSGDANKWKSNIKNSQVKKGDVAIFKSKTHVAYVESIDKKDKKGNPTSIKISEYNYGSKWADKGCIVTDKYGIVSTRVVDVSKVDGGFWRP